MARSISFIGSFRKRDHYEIVKKGVELFRNNGIVVNSPKGSEVSGSVEEFVIFSTDDQNLTPAEIQMITLDKILRSDVVLVCDLDGYVGRTTCYEIGFCFSRNIPLYFLEAPKDLPFPKLDKHVVDFEQMLSIALNNEESVIENTYLDRRVQNAALRIWPSHLNSVNASSKRIVICGRMQFYNEMQECQDYLLEQGIDAIIPKDEGTLPKNITEDEFRLFKRKVSSSYLKKIREKETGAVLVYNVEKNGKENYIGANTFVELAMAFSWNRRIFLLNDIYAPYADELDAWGVICLHGRLEKLVELWGPVSERHEREPFIQMTFSDYEDDHA